MGEEWQFWWGNLRERERLEDPGIDGNIILRWIFRKWDVVVWTGSTWLRIGTDGGHLWLSGRPDHDQQHCYHPAPTVKPETVTAVVELLVIGVRTP